MFVERDGELVRIAEVRDECTWFHGSAGRVAILDTGDRRDQIEIYFHRDLPFRTVPVPPFETHGYPWAWNGGRNRWELCLRVPGYSYDSPTGWHGAAFIGLDDDALYHVTVGSCGSGPLFNDLQQAADAAVRLLRAEMSQRRERALDKVARIDEATALIGGYHGA